MAGSVLTERPVSAWGRLTADRHRWVTLTDRHDVAATISAGGLPYGNGRSYGDVCLNPGGILWNARGLDRFIAFDPAAGSIDCEAGVLLKDIIDLVLPRGWFLPVVPGTQFITVGGAIANDVHGKAHHVAGSIGDQVESFELARTDGARIECSRLVNPDWFRATIGGLGLTGLVTRARLRLRKVPGPWLDAETLPFESLEEFFALSEESRERFDYTVSWIDCMRGGRGVFFRGNHSELALPSKARRPMSFPIDPPVSLINALSLRAFNFAYYHANKLKKGRAVQHYLPFFFPLDNLLEWNRIYGRKGFYQYQAVVPATVQLEATRALLEEIERCGIGSFLAVLKTFGSRPAPGLLSFPMHGTTLALDFPNQDGRTLALFSRLDAVVSEAGGRLYPAKDARMSAAMFAKGYPNLAEFSKYRDPGISSSMSRRLLAH